MLMHRESFKTATINSDILVIGGQYRYDMLYSVETFRNRSKRWVRKTELPAHRTDFSICSFKQNLYVIGGSKTRNGPLNSCLIYNIKCNRWSQIADMNEERCSAACTVYEGKLFVSGGLDERPLKSVESYDYFINK